MKKKKDDYLLELSSRRKIYHFILKHPGTYLREISREIKVAKSTVDYHLRSLKKLDLINAKTVGRYTRYYVKQEIGRHAKNSLNILRKQTALHIALILSMRHVCTRIQFSKELEKSPSTVTYHLKKLIEADVVRKFKDNNKIKYRLKDEKSTDKLLIQYREGLLDELVVTFYDYYLMWSKYKWFKLMIKFLNDKNNAKMHDEFFYELFPHPYYG